MKTTTTNKSASTSNAKVVIDLKKYLSRKQIAKLVKLINKLDKIFTMKNVIQTLLVMTITTFFTSLFIYIMFFAPMWMM